MSKIAFVLCHSSSELHGEIREGIIACQLAILGHDVRLFRLYVGAKTLERRYFEGLVPASFIPADNPSDPVHRHISSELLRRIDEWSPDVIVYKGIGYDVVDSVVDARSKASLHCFILGGLSVAPCLRSASLVLVEHDDQRLEVEAYLQGKTVACKTLSKYVDWATIHAISAQNVAKDFDVVNVGYFEIRKNQAALHPLFDKYRVAMVGHGEQMASVVKLAEGRSNVSFMGPLKNAEALGVIARAKVMVHTSNFEGLPRVIGEALSLGVPFVGYAHAIRARFPADSGVFLTSVEDLIPTAKALLDDPDRLAIASKQAASYAAWNYGRRAIHGGALAIDELTGD